MPLFLALPLAAHATSPLPPQLCPLLLPAAPCHLSPAPCCPLPLPPSSLQMTAKLLRIHLSTAVERRMRALLHQGARSTMQAQQVRGWAGEMALLG